ncbi:Sulfite exporter TauE/SafE [Lachnospiraceae bacterium XBB1006]|nr:Sulfite exporter TauE/SafE [Lachnospiraceae bacterium XBB1006]
MAEMAMNVMKGLALFGVVLNAFLLWRKTKQLRATTEKDEVFGLTGEEIWQKQKQPRRAIPNAIIGFVANFFDTLGIGSFAPSSSAFKFAKSVDDINIPGTLNVGDTFPVCIEAFLFFGIVKMDLLTLALMIIASVLGALLGAGVVSKFDRKKVRYSMFIGLFILGLVMLCRALGVGPFGVVGTATKLTGAKLVIAVVCNFVFGALMCVGVGLYAPCMALCAVLGLDVHCAFPAMMGSCAYLMAFGNGPKFIKEGRLDFHATWMQGIFGCIGVFVAYYVVKSMPLEVLTYVVIVVCELTAALFLKDAILKGSEA